MLGVSEKSDWTIRKAVTPEEHSVFQNAKLNSNQQPSYSSAGEFLPLMGSLYVSVDLKM